MNCFCRLPLFGMEEIRIISNWNSVDDRKLKNLITFASSGNKECEIDKVTQESCICLTEDEDGNLNSKPELEIKSQYLITEINILSEGSLIEVFGLHDEYLFTCVSELIDDWEGMAVYHSLITLPGINSCKLKFTRIKEKGRLWLYSIQLSITKAREPSQTLFNFENVNKLTNNPNQQLSEKAKKFRKFFELYAKNSSQGFSFQNLMSIINNDCNLKYLDSKQTMLDCLNSSNFKKFSENLSLRKESKVSINEFSVEYQFLKDYIDNRFMEMKNDLIRHIEIKLKELKDENRFMEMKNDLIRHMEIKLKELKDENNAKLDFIIRLLKDSKL